jgi:hypothetical protein
MIEIKKLCGAFTTPNSNSNPNPKDASFLLLVHDDVCVCMFT